MAASLVPPDGGKIDAPLNVTATAPVLDLKGFHWQAIDETPPSQILDEHVDGRVNGQRPLTDGPKALERSAASAPSLQKPPLSDNPFGTESPPRSGVPFPLDQFAGTYAGNGFNMIFRPRASGINKKTENLEKEPKGQEDNILEVNLTTEQLSFGGQLGDIPNRGLFQEADIHLAGVPYVQTVQDRTNEESGLGDNPDKTDIHFEPGVFLLVPASDAQDKKASIVRMATIPHGTTINAQSLLPPDRGLQPAKPDIGNIDTTPTIIGQTKPLKKEFEKFSMDAGNQETFRIPQNLQKFGDKGTKRITTEFIQDPNQVLRNALTGLTIEETVSFEVSTNPSESKLVGGGTTNIAFLGGKPQLNAAKDLSSATINEPTAQAVSMKARYWIERVLYDVTVPVVKKGGTVKLRPTMPQNSTAPTPVFEVTVGEEGNKVKKNIKIHGTQIQVSQKVLLNFAGLSWPHVSVSTLVPKSPQPFRMF